MNNPPVTVRKTTNWKGRPIWQWRCQLCVRPKGRKPIGGEHRVYTFTGSWRPNYPPAFRRCVDAAVRHVRAKHNPASAWPDQLKQAVDELCRASI